MAGCRWTCASARSPDDPTRSPEAGLGRRRRCLSSGNRTGRLSVRGSGCGSPDTGRHDAARWLWQPGRDRIRRRRDLQRCETSRGGDLDGVVISVEQDRRWNPQGLSHSSTRKADRSYVRCFTVHVERRVASALNRDIRSFRRDPRRTGCADGGKRADWTVPASCDVSSTCRRESAESAESLTWIEGLT